MRWKSLYRRVTFHCSNSPRERTSAMLDNLFASRRRQRRKKKICLSRDLWSTITNASGESTWVGASTIIGVRKAKKLIWMLSILKLSRNWWIKFLRFPITEFNTTWSAQKVAPKVTPLWVNTLSRLKKYNFFRLSTILLNNWAVVQHHPKRAHTRKEK